MTSYLGFNFQVKLYHNVLKLSTKKLAYLLYRRYANRWQFFIYES